MIPRSNTGRLGKAGRWCRTRRYSEQAGQARGSDLRPVLRLVRRFRLGEGGRLARRRLRTGGDLHQAAQLCLERVQIPSGKLRAAGELDGARIDGAYVRSEEHTSELQSLMRISYAVFRLKKKTYT